MSESAGAPGPQSAASSMPEGGLAFVMGTDQVELTSESIPDALMRLSTHAPDRPAVMWTSDHGPQSLSWSALCERAGRMAATLIDINPHRGRVALASLNSTDWIVAMFACALSGMPIVPVSASSTAAEAEYQLEHARVSLVLAARSAGDHPVLDRMRALAESSTAPIGVRDIADVGSAAPSALGPVSHLDEFLVQYTSGTTGRPKAASLSHRAALNCGVVFARAIGGKEGDRFLNPLPLHHVGGSVTGLITVLAMGGTYVLVERFSPQSALDALRQIRPTLAGLVPTMMIDLLAMPGVTPDDFSSVRTVIGGATAVDPGLVEKMERRLGINVIGSYGQSEAPAMTASSADDPTEVRTQTLGRCLIGRDLCIRDRAGEIATIGAVGELCVRGPLTMTGYLRPDGGLDPAVDSSGWRRTGDLCSMDGEGLVTFHGRIREVIIRGGLNVYPAEVEQALSTHESVSEIAVFGVGDARLGEIVVAAVIPAPDAQVDVAEIAALAAVRLSSYKRPAKWVVVTTLPRTSSGKVRKHLLSEWYAAGTLDVNCGVGLAAAR
jgi:fatty-acyl-CoA synthase